MTNCRTGNPTEFQKLAMECAKQQPLVDAYSQYVQAKEDLVAGKELLKDAAGDAEMEEMANEEITSLQVLTFFLIEWMVLTGSIIIPMVVEPAVGTHTFVAKI